MTERIKVAGLQISTTLYDFVRNEISPDSGIECDDAWQGFEGIINEMMTKNSASL